MKKTAVVALLVVAGLFVACTAFAADEPQYTRVKTPDLIGKQVRNPAGIVLGKLDDYVINLKDGTVVYGVLHYGDTLGFGGKLFAIPPQALSLAPDLKAVVLDVDKGDLDKEKGFDANKWPTSPDDRWGKKSSPKKDEPKKDEPRKDEANKDKKDEANRDEDKAFHLRRVTSLMGTAVKNTKGEELGTVQGFALDMKDNKVVYAGMSYGGVVGIGAKYFAIPWGALVFESPTLKAGDRAFIIDIAKEELEKGQGFDPKMWPTEPDSSFKVGGTKNEPPKKP